MAATLAVEGLEVAARRPEGLTKLVEGVSVTLQPGRTLALVGESGCGKSVTAHAVLGLLPSSLVASGGRVLLDGTNLLTLSPRALRAVRGRRIGMILQEPMTALNPAHQIGDQIGEAVVAHAAGLSRAALRSRVLELLGLVRIPDPQRIAEEYPHRLSGGMRQRVVIAIAIAGNPAFLIADEPTTALDVTVQAQILALLRQLQREMGLGLLLITHNLGVVAQTADDMAVMYAGRIVERGPVAAIFAAAAHPYTRGLLRAVPGARGAGAALEGITGLVPPPGPARWAGCAFAARCPNVLPSCCDTPSRLREFAPGREAACLRAEEAALV